MLDVALLTCRFVLVAVFVTAAVAKLVDLSGARRAFGQLGVPERIVPAAVIVIPLLELATAVALVPAASAQVAAIAASVLLAGFTVAIGTAVARGTDADCHCFGNVSAQPVGWRTLVRNVALLALAGFVVAGGAGASATAWIADLTPVETVLAAVSTVLAVGLAFNTAFLFQLFRQNGRLWAELDGLHGSTPARASGPEIGHPAPPIDARDLDGQPVTLEDLLAGLPDDDSSLLLLFVSPDCSACDPLLPEIGRRQRAGASDPRPVMLAAGTSEDVAAKSAEHGIDSVLVIREDFAVARALGVNGAPGAIVVDSDGRVASAPAVGRVAVEALMEVSAELELVNVDGAR